MICNRFDTVVVPFPFLERPVVKVRPAVVVSVPDFNADNGHTVLAMITTGAGSSWPSDSPIIDLDRAGLRHASRVRMKLFTLPNGLIERAIGNLSDVDGQALTARLEHHAFGLKRFAPKSDLIKML